MSRFFVALGPVAYASCIAPPLYKCSKCGAHGVKMWRPYQTVYIELLCAPCAVIDQKKTGTVDETGRLMGTRGDLSDQIGWYIPAVPTEDGETYWGYTSVPETGVMWWKRLPTTLPPAIDKAKPGDGGGAR